MVYRALTSVTCFRLFVQEMAMALSRALLNAGSNIPARMAMIAMTTVYSFAFVFFWCILRIVPMRTNNRKKGQKNEG